MMGSNDSTNSSNKLQHVPLERYKTNLSQIIDGLIEFCQGRERIILISPARIFDSKWSEIAGKKNEECTHSDELVRSYAQASIDIAREKKIDSLDLNGLMQDYGPNYDELLDDGLHFSSNGGQFLFDNLVPLFDRKIGNTLKFEFPHWKDIDLSKNKIDQ